MGTARPQLSAASLALCLRRQRPSLNLRPLPRKAGLRHHRRSHLFPVPRAAVNPVLNLAIRARLTPTKLLPPKSLRPLPRITKPQPPESAGAFLRASRACDRRLWRQPACGPWHNSFCRIARPPPTPGLKRMPAHMPKKMPERWPGLLLGYAHVLDKDYAKAIDPLNRAKVHAGDLGDYVSYYLGNFVLQTGRTAEGVCKPCRLCEAIRIRCWSATPPSVMPRRCCSKGKRLRRSALLEPKSVARTLGPGICAGTGLRCRGSEREGRRNVCEISTTQCRPAPMPMRPMRS